MGEDSMASKGGKARAAKMTPEERSAAAKSAAESRWAAKLPRATHGSPDHPLKIGGVEIQAYVLEDGTRVLTQGDFQEAIGRHRKASVRYKEEEGEAQTPPILQGRASNPFVTKELLEKSAPIKFRTPQGSMASGYRAEILPDVCEVFLKARDAEALQPQQEHIAERADLLIRGMARVGIIALVDEATGYQYARTRDELQEILERYISKELARWQPTFDPEFYKQMFRLRKWQYDLTSSRRPYHAAHLTVDLTYERIHPDLLRELRGTKAGWEGDGGKKGGKLHQFLTTGEGHPRLKQHIEGVKVVMILSKTWEEFYDKLNQVYPRINETLRIPFPEPAEDVWPPAAPHPA